MKTKKTYNIFLLDADQTVFDFEKSERAAFYELFKDLNLTANDEIYKSYSDINKMLWDKSDRGEIAKKEIFEKRFEMVFEKYHLDGKNNDINLLFTARLSKHSHLLSGALDFLKFLQSRGDIYLATNGRVEVQKSRIKLSGIDKFLKGVFISDEIGAGKPDIKFFQHIAARVKNFDKEKTLMIGDSLYSDIKGAVNFGIDSAWVNFYNAAAVSGITPTYTVDSYAKLKEILK